MKLPFPKWVGKLAGTGGLLGGLAAAYMTRDWISLGIGILSVVAMFSHSSGGSTPPPTPPPPVTPAP